MQMVFDKVRKIFIAKVTFEERHIAKDAGFKWNPLIKSWWTDEPRVAIQLFSAADKAALEVLENYHIVLRSDKVPLIWPPHLTPFDFQITASTWACSRNRSYLALDPGLGKTICAAIVFNSRKDLKRLVYVCPPFLLKNVENELRKWHVSKDDKEIIVKRVTDDEHSDATVLLVPDSMLIRPHIIEKILKFKGDGLVVDEAHRYKSVDALRTKALFSISKHFKFSVFMSGTPMPNRPVELWPVIKNAAWDVIEFEEFFKYGIKYCAGYKDTFGWDFNGASNVEELFSNLKKKFMLRMTKDEVLKELPEKIEGVVFVDKELSPKLKGYEKKLLADHLPENLASVIGDTHLATYRKELGISKAAFTADFVDDFLTDNPTESVLLFAIHRESISELEKRLAHHAPLVITGSVDKDERMKRADKFMQDENSRLMILNIQAGGIGFNLTKASRVIFAEFSWVPSDNTQAADRAHRIGQKKSVLVQYILFQDSLDALVLNTVMNKQKLVSQL